MIEFELKAKVADHGPVREALRARGARHDEDREEHDVYYNHPVPRLRRDRRGPARPVRREAGGHDLQGGQARRHPAQGAGGAEPRSRGRARPRGHARPARLPADGGRPQAARALDSRGRVDRARRGRVPRDVRGGRDHRRGRRRDDRGAGPRARPVRRDHGRADHGLVPRARARGRRGAARPDRPPARFGRTQGGAGAPGRTVPKRKRSLFSAHAGPVGVRRSAARSRSPLPCPRSGSSRSGPQRPCPGSRP